MIWLTSYWIGAMIIAVNFLDGERFCIIGNKYDKVLPVPVGAVTIMFRCYNRQGITWVCTAVGLWNPNPYNPSISGLLIWYFLSWLQKVLYYFGEIAQSHWAVQSLDLNVMLFKEIDVLSFELAIQFLNEILFVGFGFGLLFWVGLIELAACLKVHVGFGLFVDYLLFELVVGWDRFSVEGSSLSEKLENVDIHVFIIILSFWSYVY